MKSSWVGYWEPNVVEYRRGWQEFRAAGPAGFPLGVAGLEVSDWLDGGCPLTTPVRGEIRVSRA